MNFTRRRPFVAIILQAFILLFTFAAQGQTPPPDKPLTSPELVHLVYQLPKHPEQRDEIVTEIRKRGIGFPLTDGMRSLVEAKSGSDAVLRRTLEEAERRRANPKTETRLTEKEASDVLRQTTTMTLAAANAMPDFIVKQLIKRSVAFGRTANWLPQDTLSIGVSFRQSAGEQYRLLAVNGVPPGPEVATGGDYNKYVKGTTSSGVEYVTGLASIFGEDAHASFKAVDTDLLRGRATIVYEYEVKLPYSTLTLKSGDVPAAQVGSRGRLWVDRETYRVLRLEQIASEIPPDFPIKAASSLIDFDWVTINEQKYLLPLHSDVLLTSLYGNELVQSRNDIRFRGYQKFGAELKIIDDDEEAPPEKLEKPHLKQPEPRKPGQP